MWLLWTQSLTDMLQWSHIRFTVDRSCQHSCLPVLEIWSIIVVPHDSTKEHHNSWLDSHYFGCSYPTNITQKNFRVQRYILLVSTAYILWNNSKDSEWCCHKKDGSGGGRWTKQMWNSHSELVTMWFVKNGAVTLCCEGRWGAGSV